MGSIIGGVAQAGGSLGAATIEANAANNASKNQMAMYQQTRGDLSPFMMGGASALTGLSGLLPGFTSNLGASDAGLSALLGLTPGGSSAAMAQLQNMPGYQFALQQGQQGLDRTAAAKGLLMSGGQMKDTMQFNQGMASQQYQNAINSLQGYRNSAFPQIFNVANLGESASAGVGNAGMNAATQAGQSQMYGAGAIASGINNAGNALSGTLNNALQGYAINSTGGGFPDQLSITPNQLTGVY